VIGEKEKEKGKFFDRFRERFSESAVVEPLPLSVRERFTGTSSDVSEFQRKIVTTGVMVVAGYSGWSALLTRVAASHGFVRYSEFVDVLEEWNGTRVDITEHVNRMLHQASTLGKKPFFARDVRFGTISSSGDVLYVDLDYERLRELMTGLIITLQAVRGEGKLQRRGLLTKADLPSNPSTSEQAQNDSAFNIANKLAEINRMLSSDDFLTHATFTQEEFEAKYNLTWTNAQ